MLKNISIILLFTCFKCIPEQTNIKVINDSNENIVLVNKSENMYIENDLEKNIIYSKKTKIFDFLPSELRSYESKDGSNYYIFYFALDNKKYDSLVIKKNQIKIGHNNHILYK